MPSGWRTPPCPSMMNSCSRMWSTCCSIGMFTARAVSMTRSMSYCDTSLSLIATMPCELKLLMWLPAIPVITSRIFTSAMSSASSSERWMAVTVDSMFTTVPFLRPREGWLPMPMRLSVPSGVTSATRVTIFEVPMSRATSRLRLSRLRFTIMASPSSSCAPALRRRLPVRRRDAAQRESVRVTQVGVGRRARRRRRCAATRPRSARAAARCRRAPGRS